MEERASEFFSFALQVFALTNWARAQSLKEQLLFITSTFSTFILFFQWSETQSVDVGRSSWFRHRDIPCSSPAYWPMELFVEYFLIIIYNVLLIIILVPNTLLHACCDELGAR